MPLLLNVANFSGVRIHFGNSAVDTDGCILVGEPLRDDFITHSVDTFRALMQKMDVAVRAKQVITIEII